MIDLLVVWTELSGDAVANVAGSVIVSGQKKKKKIQTDGFVYTTVRMYRVKQTPFASNSNSSTDYVTLSSAVKSFFHILIREAFQQENNPGAL